jgi:DNA-binding CsgD family transcriptional regulator
LHTTEVGPAQQVVDETAAHDVVAAALDDLSESDAELLRLWAWEQLGPAEIAEVLGCSPGTARTRMHRARARLREALVQRGVSGPGVDGPGVDGPGTQNQPDAATSPTDTLTTPNGSEATR